MQNPDLISNYITQLRRVLYHLFSLIAGAVITQD